MRVALVTFDGFFTDAGLQAVEAPLLDGLAALGHSGGWVGGWVRFGHPNPA